jgi:hypothetical protein
MDFDVRPPETTSATTFEGWRVPRQIQPATAFSSVPEQWADSVADRLARLAQLEPGWDGHRASPISRTIIDYACNLLPRIMALGLPAPFIAPLPFGGLQLEWHRNGRDLEIEIHAPSRLYAYYCELATGSESEMELRDDLAALAPVLKVIRG